jgi:hypothetical protein
MGEAFSDSRSTEANFNGAVSAQVNSPLSDEYTYSLLLRSLRWLEEIEPSPLPQRHHQLSHQHSHHLVEHLKWLPYPLVFRHEARNLLMMMMLLPQTRPSSLLPTLSNTRSKSSSMKSSQGERTSSPSFLSLCPSSPHPTPPHLLRLDLKAYHQNGVIRINNSVSLSR